LVTIDGGGGDLQTCFKAGEGDHFVAHGLCKRAHTVTVQEGREEGRKEGRQGGGKEKVSRRKEGREGVVATGVMAVAATLGDGDGVG
jgi:hypothetical protein